MADKFTWVWLDVFRATARIAVAVAKVLKELHGPESIEAIVVRHVDGLEADCHALLAGEALFSSRSI